VFDWAGVSYSKVSIVEIGTSWAAAPKVAATPAATMAGGQVASEAERAEVEKAERAERAVRAVREAERAERAEATS
jgi:hypothetical protein